MDFEEWAAAGAARLLRFAYVTTGDLARAEDLVQDVLLDAYQRWDTVGRAASVDAYLRRAVSNRRVSWWRAIGRREVSLTLHLDVDEAALQPDPDDGGVWRACLALTERRRTAVVLRYYEHLSYAEIAEHLGCQEATARSLVKRALDDLRATLTPEDHHA